MLPPSQDFDALFHALLTPGALPSPPAAPRRRARPSPDLELRLRRALGLFHQGEYQRCMASLHELREEAPGDARLEAFVAASRALAQGAVVPGVKTCLAALRRGSHVPDVCLALGAILLQAGERAKAHAAFRKGLDADPVHPYLRARVRSMGVRRPPVLRRLPRTHPVNRVLGLLRARLSAA